MHFAKIEGFERDQTVFDGIVQMTVFALATCGVSLSMPRMRILRTAMIAVVQREPPSRFAIVPDRILYRKQVKRRHDLNPQVG